MNEVGTVTLASRTWAAVRKPDGTVEWGTSMHRFPAAPEIAATFRALTEQEDK